MGEKCSGPNSVGIAYSVKLTEGKPRMITVEVFFYRDLEDDGLKVVVDDLMVRLMNDEAGVVLLRPLSIRRWPYTTLSFTFRISSRLAQSGVTVGLFNFHTSRYEIQISHHPEWPAGSCRGEVGPGHANGATANPVPADSPAAAERRLKDHKRKLAEAYRLRQLLEQSSHSMAKQRRRRERLATLLGQLGLSSRS